MNIDFGTGTDRIYNIVSILFLVAALFVCIGTTAFAFLAGTPQDDTPEVALELPTQLPFPTITETFTPTITRTPPPASFTPTDIFTETSIPSVTFTPTFTTSPTLSPTPTITTTVLPSATATETNTPAPTLGTPPPSPSPFLFALQDEVVYTSNLDALRCSWQGIRGQVLDLNGNAYPAELVINVTGGGLPQALTGINGDYTPQGPGGYEVQLANGINTQTYFVQLVSTFGTPVSEVIQVAFPGTCEGNLALVTFIQSRPN